MLYVRDRILIGMGILRSFSALMESAVAFYIMFRARSVEDALVANSLLGLTGPVAFVLVSALGLYRLAQTANRVRLLLVAAGIFLVYLGTRE